MRSGIHTAPPLVDKEALKIFNFQKNGVKNFISRHLDKYNQQFDYSRRKYRVTKTYWHTINGLVDSLANSFRDGKMRTDGYFFTSYARIAKFSNKCCSRTAKRHLQLLQKKGIIKDIDGSTRGEVHYGFWVRLADWITEELVGKVSAAIYEAKKAAIEQAKAPAPVQEQAEPDQKLTAEIKQVVSSMTNKIDKRLKSTESLGAIFKLFSWKTGTDETPPPA